MTRKNTLPQLLEPNLKDYHLIACSDGAFRACNKMLIFQVGCRKLQTLANNIFPSILKYMDHNNIWFSTSTYNEEAKNIILQGAFLYVGQNADIG